jgi:regulator of sigma E protease
VSWLLAFLGFAVLIILHEFGHFIAAKAVGMRVERFALFFPPLLWKVRRGETEYGVGAIPLGGYVRITGMNPHEEIPPEVAHRAYYKQAPWKRIVVILAGPVMNLIVAAVLIWGLFVVHGTYVANTTVDEISKGAAATGVLQRGDDIIAVDGARGDFEQLRDQIGTHRCAAGTEREGCRAATPAVLTVRRDGEIKTLEVKPTYSKAADRMLLGFLPGQEIVHAGPIEGIGKALDQMWFVTHKTVGSIGRLVYDSAARKEVSSVAGAYVRTRNVIEEDQLASAIWLLAVISLSLAIINLFPFLPLDGGHIFWALAEKVRGRQIDFRVMERASVVGFALVLMLFAIGLSNDISWFRDGSPMTR